MNPFDNEIYFIKNLGRYTEDDDIRLTKELKRQSKPKKQVVEHNVSQKFNQKLKTSRR